MTIQMIPVACCWKVSTNHISNIQYSRRHKNVMNVMWRSCGSLGLTQWHWPSGTLGRIQRRNVVLWWYKGEHIDSCEDWTCYNSEYNCSSWITSITDSRCQLQAMQHNAILTYGWYDIHCPTVQKTPRPSPRQGQSPMSFDVTPMPLLHLRETY